MYNDIETHIHILIDTVANVTMPADESYFLRAMFVGKSSTGTRYTISNARGGYYGPREALMDMFYFKNIPARLIVTPRHMPDLDGTVSHWRNWLIRGDLKRDATQKDLNTFYFYWQCILSDYTLLKGV